MDANHHNELIEISQEIYDQATDRITNYCAQKYCAVSNDTMEQQMEDYLFIAKETSVFLLANALALLAPESREAEIKSINKDLRRIIRFAQQKAGEDPQPS